MMVGKSWLQVIEAAGHIVCTVRKQRVMDIEEVWKEEGKGIFMDDCCGQEAETC